MRMRSSYCRLKNFKAYESIMVVAPRATPGGELEFTVVAQFELPAVQRLRRAHADMIANKELATRMDSYPMDAHNIILRTVVSYPKLRHELVLPDSDISFDIDAPLFVVHDYTSMDTAYVYPAPFLPHDLRAAASAGHDALYDMLDLLDAARMPRDEVRRVIVDLYSEYGVVLPSEDIWQWYENVKLLKGV